MCVITGGEKGSKPDLRCSEPPKPLKHLLTQISESEPMAINNEPLGKRYMRIFAVVFAYW